MESPVPQYAHQTVMLGQALDALAIDGARAAGVYVDGTFGRGGHSRGILERLDPQGRLIAFDKDPEAIAASLAIRDGRFEIVHGSFASLLDALRGRQISAVDGILLDLGISSPQIDDASRGFSFRQDGPLDMRMNPLHGLSAAQWLEHASQEELREVIRDYGEERFALQIAKAVVARRAERPVSTTRELASLVAGVVRTREKGQDPATRTFQAIRIYINQELAELEQGLAQAMEILNDGGRLVVISFHSLEDRIVKRFLQRLARPPEPPAHLPIKARDLPRAKVRLVSKQMPLTGEIAANPRARSAVMRVAERLGREPM
jgi:16S rRNA (cytosine1402-N4)-methyltransferase